MSRAKGGKGAKGAKGKGRPKPPLWSQRVAEYVIANWTSTRAAGDALGVDHSVLWRAMQGYVQGPSAELLNALADHSGLSTDHFLGRD